MRKLGIENQDFENNIEKAVMKRESLREQQDMKYVSPLNVPKKIKKEGFEYKWVPYHLRGEDTFDVEQKMREGWEPVPVSRAQEYAADFLGRNPAGKKYITYKDVVLMERPEELGKRDNEIFNELNANQIKSLRGVSNDIRGMEAPLYVMNKYK